MPLRSDPTLWWNLPGIVAAYQPVKAPNSLLALYNQAHGGDNKYKAIDTQPPVWSGSSGWYGNGTDNAYLRTGIIPAFGWSAIISFNCLESDNNQIPFGTYANTATTYFAIQTRYSLSDTHYYFNGGLSSGIAPRLTRGVAAISKNAGYLNGKLEASGWSDWSGTGKEIYLMAFNSNGAPQTGTYVTGYVYCVAFYARPLSAAEVWSASRQMQYCDVNPDWSAWTPRRKWYYAPSAASFLASWAAGSNQMIGGGTP